MTRLEELYKKDIVPKMKDKFNLSNSFEVPKIDKITINIGVGPALKDKKLLGHMVNSITKISGQAPIKTLSKKAISGRGCQAIFQV